MDGFSYVDLFAGKGIEYLLVVLFAATLVPFWLGLNRRKRQPAGSVASEDSAREWFRLPPSYQLHPGHTWAAPGPGRSFRTGLDQLAASFFGRIDGLVLPSPGTELRQGAPAWSVRVGQKRVDMPAPVSGRVRAVNAAARNKPSIASLLPYGKGWLLEIVPHGDSDMARGLLSGGKADGYLIDSLETLNSRLGASPGLVMQDGGTPVPGFGLDLFPSNWQQVALELFPVDEDCPQGGKDEPSVG